MHALQGRCEESEFILVKGCVGDAWVRLTLIIQWVGQKLDSVGATNLFRSFQSCLAVLFATLILLE